MIGAERGPAADARAGSVRGPVVPEISAVTAVGTLITFRTLIASGTVVAIETVALVHGIVPVLPAPARRRRAERAATAAATVPREALALAASETIARPVLAIPEGTGRPVAVGPLRPIPIRTLRPVSVGPVCLRPVPERPVSGRAPAGVAEVATSLAIVPRKAALPATIAITAAVKGTR